MGLKVFFTVGERQFFSQMLIALLTLIIVFHLCVTLFLSFFSPQVVDVVPTLPDIPLPAIQPNYRPLPSIDVTPLSPQRRKGCFFFFLCGFQLLKALKALSV